LAEQVRRAADLIELCRGRLENAQVEVTRIVADLDALDSNDEEEE
jgi:exonuclease VII small subunit